MYNKNTKIPLALENQGILNLAFQLNYSLFFSRLATSFIINELNLPQHF